MNKYLLTLSACLFASSAFVAHASPSFSDMSKIMAQGQTDIKDGKDSVNLGKEIQGKKKEGKKMGFGDISKVTGQGQKDIKDGKDSVSLGKNMFAKDKSTPAA